MRRRKELSALIEWVFNSSRGTYGYRRTHAALARRGVETSPDTVRSIMRSQCPPGRTATPKGPGATVPAADLGSRPDLVRRNFTANRPGVKWVGDITYIRTWEGFVYLATVLDCCTKKAVGYAMADNMRTDLICEAIDMAARRCPYTRGETVFHSDRGCQYTSEQFSQHLGRYEIIASTGRTGVCWDNAWAEVGGCDPQGTRGSIRWCIPQEARPSGILPPRSSPVHTIRNDSTPPWGTGRRARSARSTEQQDKQPERPLSGLSETRPAVHPAVPGDWRPPRAFTSPRRLARAARPRNRAAPRYQERRPPQGRVG